MLRVALKNLAARKGRVVTTSIAVVLGIAFLTGTLLLSNTLSASIKSLIGDVYEGFDAVVRSSQTQETPFGQPLRSPLPAPVVEEVRGVDGVRADAGIVEAAGAELIDRNGKVFGGGFGPPTITYNWVDDEVLRLGKLTDGRGPRADTEVVLDFRTAGDLGLTIGDQVTLATTQAGRQQFTLVGLVGLGPDGTQSSGAKVMFFTTPEAQRLTNQPDQFNYVAVSAADGVSQQELARALARALPDQQVLTGEAFTKESQEQIAQFVDILGIFVSVFGYIALFVSVFIIYNTFSIIVAQRTRETALLRAIGARRRQVLAATMAEALLIGAVASVLGLGLGVVLATGLIRVVSNFFTVTSSVPSLSAGIVVLALVIGLGVTALSAFIPALRSTKIPPIAALQEVSLDRTGLSTARKVWGTLLVLSGLLLMGLGLADIGPNPLAFVGGGAAALLVSVAVILGPAIASPVSRLLARPFSWGGRMTGRLAGENAARNPKRTAATAAALTIGVTLVVVIAIVASSIKATADETISQSVKAQFVVATSSLTSFGAIPEGSVERIAAQPGVAVASPVRFTFLTLADPQSQAEAASTTTVPAGQLGSIGDAPPGKNETAFGIDPATWFQVVDAGKVQGSPADLTAGTMAVSERLAEDRGWKVGQKVPVYFAGTGTVDLTVAVIFERALGQTAVWLPLDTFAPNVLPLFNVDTQIYVLEDPGADPAQVRKELDALFADLPTVQVQDLQQFIETQTGPINTFLTVIYGLLFLAIVIALIGIANTLSLSVLERTRELGLLRAVGMTRRQLRAMIRNESAIIAVFGTLIGLVIGILFAIALSVAVSADNPGILRFTLPVGQLVVITVVAAIAGLLAAIVPALRASRMDVLGAISSE